MSTLATVRAMAAGLADVERVTSFPVRDVTLPAPPGQPSPGTLALITMDNGLDGKPTTLGFGGLLNFEAALDAVKQRAADVVAGRVTVHRPDPTTPPGGPPGTHPERRVPRRSRRLHPRRIAGRSSRLPLRP